MAVFSISSWPSSSVHMTVPTRSKADAFDLPHLLLLSLGVLAEPLADALGYGRPADLLRRLPKHERFQLPVPADERGGWVEYVTAQGFKRALSFPPLKGEKPGFRRWVTESFEPDLGVELIESLHRSRS